MENTKSAQPRRLHWSKDFVTHLRTVHFTLVVVTSILVITATNTEDRDRNVASDQVKQIVQFEQEWTPSKLYNLAMEDAQIKTNWTQRITLEIPEKTHALRRVDVTVDVSKDLMMSLEPWKLTSKSGSPAIFEWATRLQTLGDFMRLWDNLRRGATIVLVDPPDASSRCYAQISPHPSSGDRGFVKCQLTTAETPKSDNSYVLQLRDYRLLPKPLYTDNYETGSELRAQLQATADLPTQAGFERNSSITIALISNTREVTVNEKSPIALYPSFQWREGMFYTAFPELTRLSRDLDNKPISDAVKELPAQPVNNKDVRLLGFNVPAAGLSQWGMLILLCLQLYLWLHLHELGMRAEPDAESKNIAWIGIYESFAGVMMTIISCSLLPVVGSAVLVHRFSMIPFYDRLTMVALCGGLIISAAISIMTSWEVFRVRRTMTHSSDSVQSSATTA